MGNSGCRRVRATGRCNTLRPLGDLEYESLQEEQLCPVAEDGESVLSVVCVLEVELGLNLGCE